MQANSPSSGSRGRVEAFNRGENYVVVPTQLHVEVWTKRRGTSQVFHVRAEAIHRDVREVVNAETADAKRRRRGEHNRHGIQILAGSYGRGSGFKIVGGRGLVLAPANIPRAACSARQRSL